MAALPLAARAHVLGAATSLCEEGDPEIRAAAVALLGGATGMQALRTIVARLGDAEEPVQRAAVEALRMSARTQPMRFVHALFHPQLAVRRAALAGGVPPNASELAAYLRADPELADLTEALPWPGARLPLVFDLYAMGRLTPRAFLDQLAIGTGKELQEALAQERRRPAPANLAHLAAVIAGGRLVPAGGHDVLDGVIDAIVETGAFHHELTHLILATTRTDAGLDARLLVAILNRLATDPQPALWGAAVTLAPVLLESAAFAHAPEGSALAATHSLIRADWPVGVPADKVRALVAQPVVARDLALAAAVAGLFRIDRLAEIEAAIGEGAIVDRLRASDHGWREICQLPHETLSPRERWLASIRRWEPARASELEGIALGALHGKPLDEFISGIRDGARPAALLAFIRRTPVEATDDRLITVLGLLATRSDATDLDGVLAEMFADGAPPREREIGLAMLRVLGGKVLATIARKLSDETFARIVRTVDALLETDALPREREIVLAEVAATRALPALTAWSQRMLVPEPVVVRVARQAGHAKRVLSEHDRGLIGRVPDADLGAALRDAREVPTAGVADALSRRAAHPSIEACVALILSADPLPEIAEQLDRFVDDTHAFHARLDDALITAGIDTLEATPVLYHARMWRWEASTPHFARWVDAVGGVFEAARLADALPGLHAAQALWRAIAELVSFWRFRDRPRFTALRTAAPGELAAFAAQRVDGPCGVGAARLCVVLVEGGAVPIREIEGELFARAADAGHETREHIGRLSQLAGMPEPPRVLAPAVRPADVIAQIRATRDVEILLRWLPDDRRGVADEAALALASLGGVGQGRLATAMRSLAALPHPLALLATLPLWDDKAALAALAEIARDGSLAAEWRFHLWAAVGDHAAAIATVHEPGDATWFRRGHWDMLAAVVPREELALALVTAASFHAYTPALDVLLAPNATRGTAQGEALHAFLDLGTERPEQLRRQVAESLLVASNDPWGLPLLFAQLCEQDSVPAWVSATPAETQVMLAHALVDAALVAGASVCSEKRMDTVIGHLRKLPPELRPLLALRVLEYGQTSLARKNAAAASVVRGFTDLRMMRVARVFAWGVRRGLELAGRHLTFHLTSEQRDLGHTFLDGNAVYVTALPMLRGEPNGEDIVEGLVLHEIGHHVYHRGEEAQALWKQAHQEGLGQLLNLIADEHLERNLRAVNPEYGDRLKRLDSYAFRHAPQELKIKALLASLRGYTAIAFRGAELAVAFDEDSVRMRRGAILGQLERAGHPLARFAAALRMGLGNRTKDPLVQQALDLVQEGTELRKQDMAGMYALTRQIAALFGGATACAQVFGGPEGLGFGERDDDVYAGSIEDDKLQKEVERILDPRTGDSARSGPISKLAINVNPNEEFRRLTDVRKVHGSPEAHAKIATEVARHADRLRGHLDELGLRWTPVKGRTRGHALDRSRLRPLITHGDPRILQARTPTRRTDLFLGILVDCSGSMQSGGNIERARKFGVLIAEAVRDLPGVDARFFGFTDRVIWDAGTARKCDVVGLEANGGNNDAGALLHAAEVAAMSPKKARVLVMISDGLPTECSVAALRALVTQLTRRKGMVCAQVAVRELEEQCFPQHVLIDDSQIDVAVARFGRMIGDLVRRALGS